MRYIALLPLLSVASAVPSGAWWSSTEAIAESAINKANDWLFGHPDSLDAQQVVLNDIEYTSVSHAAFPEYRLRVTSQSKPTICDPSVKQLSGYLDISDTKHLFFWFEESRHKPAEDPLVLWLNGGPGCSSTTGLLFELGGCRVVDEGNNVTRNEDSWNNVANVLFLDQPVGVGYSYSDDGGVNNSPAAAEDVYAFLMLFISQFKEYSKQDFHIAGESYAGTYIPNIANVIHQHNSALALTSNAYAGVPTLNFKSVLIGNGLTNPYEQFGSVSDWACNGPYAVFTPGSPQCTSLEAKQPRCQNLIASCQRTNSRFACVPAGLYCWQLFNDIQQLGVNVYDVRRKCNRDKDADGPLCYKEMSWMETYLNKPEVKKQLGAPANIEFQSCNMQINQNFLLQGDGVRDTSSLLPPLIEAGIRVLIYSGEADALVNFIGCSRVVDALETSFSKEYAKASPSNFTASDGSISGWTKSAGEGAGNIAFVAFDNAGHMVPHDDPIGALTMFERWLKNKPLAK